MYGGGVVGGWILDKVTREGLADKYRSQLGNTNKLLPKRISVSVSTGNGKQKIRCGKRWKRWSIDVLLLFLIIQAAGTGRRGMAQLKRQQLDFQGGQEEMR